MNMKEIKIYFAKTAKTELIIDELASYLNEQFGGYTMYNCSGGYMDNELTEYEESTIVFEILADIVPFDWHSDIKTLFSDSGEESVLISEKCINTLDYLYLT